MSASIMATTATTWWQRRFVSPSSNGRTFLSRVQSHRVASSSPRLPLTLRPGARPPNEMTVIEQRESITTTGATGDATQYVWVDTGAPKPTEGLFRLEVDNLRRVRLIPLTALAEDIAGVWLHGAARVSVRGHSQGPAKRMKIDALEITFSQDGFLAPPREGGPLVRDDDWDTALLGRALSISNREDFEACKAALERSRKKRNKKLAPIAKRRSK